MKFLVPVICCLIFISCKESVTQLTEKVTGADSLAINYFKGDGTMDTVVAVRIIADKNKISQLAKLAGGHTIQNSNCGFDGSLHFFKNNQVIQDIQFRMNDAQCAHFSFKLEGKLYNTELSPEAKELLLLLKK
jgi:hypothetical protein